MHSDEIRHLADVEDRHWWYAERRSIIRDAVAGLAPRGVALDVGAAAGGNSRVLQSAGWRCVAVEHSELGARLALSRGLRVVRADATCMPVRDAAAGLVVAFDVLEHIPDQHAAVREAFRSLMPGGLFLVAVPADMQLWSAHDEAVEHVRRYDRDELVALVEAAGFVDVRVRSWNVLLRPVVAARRRRARGSDLKMPNSAVNAFLRGVVMAERYLPVGRRRGVSLLLSARTPSVQAIDGPQTHADVL